MALVAEDDVRIVGHVMISTCELRDGESAHHIAMLSPLAVAPDLQRGGIGSALVGAATAIADEAGEPMVILEGSPAYYSRFGFVDSRTLGIEIHLPDWAPREAGQVLPLARYDPALRGTVRYPPPFDGLE
jgi:putative acetyltransferase